MICCGLFCILQDERRVLGFVFSVGLIRKNDVSSSFVVLLQRSTVIGRLDENKNLSKRWQGPARRRE